MNVPIAALLPVAVAVAALAPPSRAAAFSVLSHEVIIDLAWDDAIAPSLRRRFPGIEPSCVDEARRFAYGGAIVADSGYFPGGSRLASDLLHYVRTGDLVLAMLTDARDPNEVAFAFGLLAHHVGDTIGHEQGTNRAVPIAFPELRARFGDVVTYADDRRAHIRLEMGLDALECARRGWLPRDLDAFLDFAVADDLLARVFRDTYGLSLEQLSPNLDVSIRTFRFAVTEILPGLLKESIKASVAAHPGKGYRLPRVVFEARFGKNYRRPRWTARFIGFLMRHLGLGFTPLLPPPAAERMYRDSLVAVLSQYRAVLRSAEAGDLLLPNLNLDTGALTRRGEYAPLDHAYAELLRRLDRNRFLGISRQLRRDLLTFYGSRAERHPPERHQRAWRRTMRAVERLREAAPASTVQSAQ